MTKASRHHNLGAFELQTFTFLHNSLPYHQKLVQLTMYLLRFVYTVCLLRFESRLDFTAIALHDLLLTLGESIRQKVQLKQCLSSSVREIQHSGVSQDKYSTRPCLMLYLSLEMPPHVVFPVQTHGSALSNTNCTHALLTLATKSITISYQRWAR